MPKSKILGIDIGNYRVKLALCENGKFRKQAAEVLPDGIVRDDLVVSWDAMGDFLKEVIKKNGMNCKNAAVSLPMEACFTRTVKLPKMTTKQLEVNLPYEFHDYITSESDQYVYDYAVLDMDENEMTLLAVAAHKDMMKHYADMCHRAGLRLVLIAPEVVALENMILIHEKQAGVEHGSRDYAVLDIGDHSIKLHFFTKGEYEVTRTMEPGLRIFAKMIADLKGKDEHIAQISAESNHDQVLEQEQIVDQANQMAVQIMRVLNFYSFNNPNNTIEALYFCGGGARNEVLMNEIGEVTGMPLKEFSDLVTGSDRAAIELTESPQAFGITLSREEI